MKQQNNKEIEKENKRLIDYCIGTHRLDDERESKTMNWLLGNSIQNNCENLRSIKDLILCMDKFHNNYKYLNYNDKLLVDELIENEKIVNIVLVSLFRWFGSSVGEYSLKELQGEKLK